MSQAAVVRPTSQLTVAPMMPITIMPAITVAVASDIEALVTDQVQRTAQIYVLEQIQVSCGTHAIPTATVRLRGPDGEMHTDSGQDTGPVDAMYEAFAEERDITTDDIARAAARTVPLSRSQREVIEDLRAWLREGRAQSASFAGAAQAAEHQVPVLEV